jgi:glutathione S-transferase
MTLKFYMTPGSCSTGIHILLETLELPFEVWIINLPAGEHLRPEYLKINTRIFTSERYIASSEAQQGLHLKDDVASHGREIVSQAFGILEKRMPAEGYAVGPQFSIADAALFYNEFWADKIGIPLPPRVAAHYQRVRARPVVRQVLAEEGYRS